MTFPLSLHNPTPKDTTADEVVSPQFYINGVDINNNDAEIKGIQNQLGLSRKCDLIFSGNTLNVAGPSQSTISGLIVSIPGGNVVFGAPGVFFVWIDPVGVLNNGASLPVLTNYLPIAQVTCIAGGEITAIVDLRPWLNGTGGGGGGSFPVNYRATVTEPRYARRDVIVLANTNFLPGGFIPLSDSAYFDIDVVFSVNATLTLVQIEGISTDIILGPVVANTLKRFRVQAPKQYDGGAMDIEYQLKFSMAGTVEFLGIMEIDFDALVETTPVAGGGTQLIPFQVAFLFSTGSPLTLFSLLAGDVVTECELVIQTAFDTVSATLEVGVAGDTGAILDTTEISPSSIGQYSTVADRTSAIAETLILTITPSGATAGAGYVSGIIRR